MLVSFLASFLPDTEVGPHARGRVPQRDGRTLREPRGWGWGREGSRERTGGLAMIWDRTGGGGCPGKRKEPGLKVQDQSG